MYLPQTRQRKLLHDTIQTRVNTETAPFYSGSKYLSAIIAAILSNHPRTRLRIEEKLVHFPNVFHFDLRSPRELGADRCGCKELEGIATFANESSQFAVKSFHA